MAIESPRLRPAFACTLHLLFTLSDRFIIALCTNPPRPLVGDGGRSGDDNKLGLLPSPTLSDSNEVLRSNGLNTGKSRRGVLGGEDDMRDVGLAGVTSSTIDLRCSSSGSVDADFRGDPGGVAFSVSFPERSWDVLKSLDIPGSLIPRLVKEGAASASVSFLRYAPDPIPRSAVWRNHEGSLAPNDAAMSFLENSSVLLGRSRPGEALESGRDTIDCGRDLIDPTPLEDGLCCQDKVPLLDNAVTFGGGLGMDGVSKDGGGRGRERSRPATEARSGLGDIESDRPIVRD